MRNAYLQGLLLTKDFKAQLQGLLSTIVTTSSHQAVMSNANRGIQTKLKLIIFLDPKTTQLTKYKIGCKRKCSFLNWRSIHWNTLAKLFSDCWKIMTRFFSEDSVKKVSCRLVYPLDSLVNFPSKQCISPATPPKCIEMKMYKTYKLWKRVQSKYETPQMLICFSLWEQGLFNEKQRTTVKTCSFFSLFRFLLYVCLVSPPGDTGLCMIM